MVYNIISTDEMDMLLDKCVKYLLNRFKSKQAAQHLLDGISQIYDTLERTPHMYRQSEDPFMEAFEYREAKVPQMDYVVIFKVVEDKVYILGIFHTLENYVSKMKVLWSQFNP